MIFIPNCHWNHTKIEFGTIPEAIWYEYHSAYNHSYRLHGSTGISKFKSRFSLPCMQLALWRYIIVQGWALWLYIELKICISKFNFSMHAIQLQGSLQGETYMKWVSIKMAIEPRLYAPYQQRNDAFELQFFELPSQAK